MTWKNIIATLLLLPMSWAHAFTLNGSVANGRVTWDNLVLSHGQNTLSTWTPLSGLTPTTRWRPGFMASPQPVSSITLVNGGNSISLPLLLTGIEYNTGSNSITDVISSPAMTSCDNNIASGNVIQLVGAWNCSYEKLINNNASKTPFFFLRPLFSIDSNAVLTGFEGKPEGYYTGTMPMSIRYFYYTTSGALTYRDIRKSFSVQIRHKPSYISSVTLSGSGVLVPTYNKTAKTVSAMTTFQVNATGHFDKGMKMILQDRDYRLSSQTLNNTIPYSIKCSGAACADVLLVTAGALKAPSSILNAGGDKSRVDFMLDVSYENIAAANIESGRYTDSFTILFETDF